MANELSNLKPPAGSRTEPTRKGRGEGSGKGKTAGRGTKGQKARSGYSWRPGFEGGQMPLHRRLPKRGFNNKFKKEFTVLNVARLADLPEGTVVTEEFLDDNGLIAKIGKNGVKILGMGELGVALHVRVSKLSKSAAGKITAAGGTIEGPIPE